jgi:hypothetical protein
MPLTYTAPIVGQPHSSEDPKVTTALTQILSWSVSPDCTSFNCSGNITATSGGSIATSGAVVGGSGTFTNLYAAVQATTVNCSGNITCTASGSISTAGAIVGGSGTFTSTFVSTENATNINYSGSLTHVSDASLKTDIKDLDQPGLLDLRPVSYTNVAGDKQYGFVAQEIQEHLPEIVKEVPSFRHPMVANGDTPAGEFATVLGYNPDAITALLVAEVQKLRAEVDRLTAQTSSK